VEPLPEVGATAAMTVTVTDGMTARFDDEDVHPVYGTAALVRHMEQVSRRLLVGLREPGEEGVGAELSVRQMAPVPVGEEVELVATITAGTRRRMVTSVEARHLGEVVATGTFTQVTVNLAAWRARLGAPDPPP
jgi:predicted thioesterase